MGLFFSSPSRSDRLWSPSSFQSNGDWELFPRKVKRSEGKANRSSPSGAEVKNAWSFSSIPPCLNETLVVQRDKLYLLTAVGDLYDGLI